MMSLYCYKPRILLILLILLITGCDKNPPLQKITGYAQGTTYHISFWQSSEKPIDSQAIKTAIDTEFKRIDEQLSNYRPDSVIERFNATISNEPLELSEEIIYLIEQARAVSIASDGCYDLTIKPLFDLWGFKDDKLFIPSDELLKTALQQVGFKQIEIIDATHVRKANAKLRIDLSSIAQGYSVARMSALLEQQGITNYLVEIGGELQTRGRKPNAMPWRVAVEKPLSSERTMQKVLTINKTEPLVVMTSGTYRHYFDANGKRYSHILNAKTGIPVDHTTVSVTVLHNDGTQADAWSTALLCLGAKEGLIAANKAGIAALFIEQQGDNFNELPSNALTALTDVNFK
jgi:thiamine biosynthesis lipoprotein